MAEANSLLEKLDGLTARFEEISTLITDPSVIADQSRYVKLSKEYKDLERLVAARDEYKKLLQNLDESKSLLLNESDPELKEMAREEVQACEERRPQLEEEIKVMLIPQDPEDGKNAILEIRGGTGGDEAALFAGDLFRMYTKYAERKGWRLEVSSASEGAVGGFKEVICSVSKLIDCLPVAAVLRFDPGIAAHGVRRGVDRRARAADPVGETGCNRGVHGPLLIAGLGQDNAQLLHIFLGSPDIADFCVESFDDLPEHGFPLGCTVLHFRSGQERKLLFLFFGQLCRVRRQLIPGFFLFLPKLFFSCLLHALLKVRFEPSVRVIQGHMPIGNRRF